MPVPQVAIVGRPNVGKSSLLNWLAGNRISVVDETSGVTRDRVTAIVQRRDRFFEMVDTAGMGIEDVDHLDEHIEQQIEEAVTQATLILFVVDVQQGMTPLDQAVAQRLRYVSKPVICVANKCDHKELESEAADFYRLGRGKLICTSTAQNRNRDALMEMIVERLPIDLEDLPGSEPVMRVAIVGRRNVGKSTFVNTLAQAERMIVSEVPGTTRDSVDVTYELDGQSFIAIDTPGVRRKKSLGSSIDFYGFVRAQRSVRRADLVLMFFDPTQRIGKPDKQLVDYINAQHKPCIFVVNKWDLMRPMPTEKWSSYVKDTFRTSRYSPIVFVTGRTGKNVKALLNLGQHLFKQASSRISTGHLNRIVQSAMKRNPPPIRRNQKPRLFYATQVGAQPPTIVMFVNRPVLFDATYCRYLIGAIREESPFLEVPIKLYLRRREQSESGLGPEGNLLGIPETDNPSLGRS